MKKTTIMHRGKRFVVITAPTLGGDLAAVGDGIVVILDLGNPADNLAMARRLIDRALGS